MAAAAVSQAELVSGSVRSVTRPGAAHSAHNPPTQTVPTLDGQNRAPTGNKKTTSGGKGDSGKGKKASGVIPSPGGRKKGKSSQEQSSATNGDSACVEVLGTAEEIERAPGMIQVYV